MEITIDTKNKTVELKEDTNIMDLVEFLELAVGEEWEEYKILKPIRQIDYVPYYPCPCPCPSPTPIQPYYTTSTNIRL